ncbi:MAG: diguanylate cyclase (GGDEF)-like protein/PAS domain S-box-containing protein [Bermanella sp.]|jgi:diguanylate cyclase (GGDEF)-like protein/PAS domain S-box-containing protein
MENIEFEKLLRSQEKIVKLLASNQKLEYCLDIICSEIEDLLDNTHLTASILLITDSKLRMGGGTRVSDEYSAAIMGLEIGLLAGSCGSAAYTGKPSYTENISEDPKWSEFKDIAAKQNFLACWSIPIMSSSGGSIGSFGVYSSHTGLPDSWVIYLVKFFSNLASLAIEKDISKQRETVLTNQLHNALNKMHAFIRVMPDLAIILSENGNYVDTFGSDNDLLYQKSDQILGKNISDVLPSEMLNEINSVIKKTLSTNEIQRYEYQLDVAKGNCFIEARVAPVDHYSLKNKDRRHVIWMARDITERKKNELAIEKLGFYDPLTDLPNRRLLMDRLQETIKSAKRYKKIAALIFIDLDNFKQVNDTVGHSGGDALLCEIASVLQYTLRDTDTLSRIGGDEFVILLEGHDNTNQLMSSEAKRVCERIIETLKKPIYIKNKLITVSASLGITLIEGDIITADSILGNADSAMYEAKKLGKGRLRFYSSSNTTISS